MIRLATRRFSDAKSPLERYSSTLLNRDLNPQLVTHFVLMSKYADLPIGPIPGWEHNASQEELEDSGPLQSIAARCVKSTCLLIST